MSYTEIGKCPVCGAPIWAPFEWYGVYPPPPMYSCPHSGIYETFTVNSTN